MTVLSASTSQQTLVASNSSRKGLTVYNQSPATLYVSTVTGFSKGDAPTIIRPESSWTLAVRYTGPFYCVWDTARGQAQITEI